MPDGNRDWVFWIPAVATAALIALLSHQPDTGLPEGFPDKPAHFFEYAFFTMTLVYGFSRGFDFRRRSRGRIVAAVLLASAYGVTDEWHQSFVGRDASVADWLADTSGAVVAGVAAWWLWRRMAGARQRV